MPLSTVRSTVSRLTLFPLASVTVTAISVVADKLAGMAGFSDDSSTLAAADVPRSTVIPADYSSGI